MSRLQVKGYYEVSSSPTPTSSRESPKQNPDNSRASIEKRLQARERQRRKRERDKALLAAIMITDSENANIQANTADSPVGTSSKKRFGGRKVDLSELAPEEAAKRERIRLAARERQRKHRAGVKAKRMAELGMSIVNESGDIEQTAIGYTVNGNGQYEAVLVHPNDPNIHHTPLPFQPPQAHSTAGQLFASTLLVGLTWYPNLRQELLRKLRVSNEELSAFEPVMAAAFDHWQHQRSLQYAASQTQANISSQGLPYPQPFPTFDRFQRPMMAAFPPSPHQATERSPSPSDESQAGGHAESEIRNIDPPARLYPVEDQYQKQSINEENQPRE